MTIYRNGDFVFKRQGDEKGSMNWLNLPAFFQLSCLKYIL
jgi:hypothetical protein